LREELAWVDFTMGARHFFSVFFEALSRHVMACAPERERLGLRQAKLGRISQRVTRDELRRL
jgi:hypothetical protein